MYICIDKYGKFISTYDYQPSRIFPVATNLYVDGNENIYIYVNGSGIDYYSNGKVYSYGSATCDYFSNGKFYKIGDFYFDYYSNGRIYKLGDSIFDYFDYLTETGAPLHVQ